MNVEIKKSIRRVTIFYKIIERFIVFFEMVL